MLRPAQLLDRWKGRTLAAYFVSFTFVAIVAALVPIGFNSSSPTITFALLASIKSAYLPAGWLLIGLNNFPRLELGIITSLSVAFLATLPIITYTVMRLIAPQTSTKRLLTLSSGAAIVFYSGAAYGLLFARIALISAVPQFFGVSFQPVINSFDFYTLVLRLIIIGGAVAIAPICITISFQRRPERQTRSVKVVGTRLLRVPDLRVLSTMLGSAMVILPQVLTYLTTNQFEFWMVSATLNNIFVVSQAGGLILIGCAFAVTALRQPHSIEAQT